MKKIFIITYVLFIESIFAKNINFDNIDSNKTLDLISKNDTTIINSIITDNFNASSTLVLQNGNENFASINLKYNPKISATQNGDLNTLIYQDFFNPNSNAELSVITEGSGNYVEVLGSNSISNGMKIKITGNDKMIFIRNY